MASRTSRPPTDPARVAAIGQSLSALPMEQRRDIAEALALPLSLRRTIVDALADALVAEILSEGDGAIARQTSSER